MPKRDLPHKIQKEHEQLERLLRAGAGEKAVKKCLKRLRELEGSMRKRQIV